MNLLSYNNHKYISNNKTYIIKLFLEIANVKIDDSNFKIYEGDECVIFRDKGRNLLLHYNRYEGFYILLHENTKANPSRGFHYHEQARSMSLSVMTKKIASLHDPIDMNKKIDSITALFNKINK